MIISINESSRKKDIQKARELCSKVRELANQYDLPFFC